jgi:hypothetical protein
MLKLIRIPTPDWATPFERTADPAFPETELPRVLAQHDKILGIVQDAVQTYINEHAADIANDPQGFPLLERLSGEYYISDEAYWVNDQPWFERVGRHREYRFAVMTHLLAHAAESNSPGRDYCGLQVQFSWHPEKDRFEFSGDVDQFSI